MRGHLHQQLCIKIFEKSSAVFGGNLTEQIFSSTMGECFKGKSPFLQALSFSFFSHHTCQISWKNEINLFLFLFLYILGFKLCHIAPSELSLSKHLWPCLAQALLTSGMACSSIPPSRSYLERILNITRCPSSTQGNFLECFTKYLSIKRLE